AGVVDGHHALLAGTGRDADRPRSGVFGPIRLRVLCVFRGSLPGADERCGALPATAAFSGNCNCRNERGSIRGGFGSEPPLVVDRLRGTTRGCNRTIDLFFGTPKGAVSQKPL